MKTGNRLCAFLLVVTCLACLTTLCCASDRPNVLFIASDDLRPELGCYGVKEIKSPNIDRLAATGTVFLRAYCQQAVCSPSRTSLMTGLRPDSTKIYDLNTHFRKFCPDVVTLGQSFKDQGYYCVSMGKIYHGGLDDLPTWSEPARKPKNGAGYVDKKNTQMVARKRAEGRSKGLRGKDLSRASHGEPFERGEVADNKYFDGSLAELGVAALQELKKKDQPFFLAVGFHKPHLPFNAPAKYWEMYARDKIRLADNPFPPKNVTPFSLTNWGELRAYEGMPSKDDLTEEQARTLRHAYYACVSFTDANIGKLLDELDRSGLAKNTIVVLWGDHGWKLGEHNSWCKHTNFEMDAHAPLIIRVPGQKAPGGKTKALVEFVGIFPTLCDLAGIKTPWHTEGTSFAKYLDTPDAPGPTAAFSQYPRGSVMGYSMRTDRYRFTLWKNKKTGAVTASELYDHVIDPEENDNIAASPENQTLVVALQKTLDAQITKPTYQQRLKDR